MGASWYKTVKIHRNVKRRFLAVIICALWSGFLCSSAAAQEWSQPVRGSWVADGAAQAGDISLADRNAGCEIVVTEKENSALKQAAAFLAGDIEKFSGYKPPIIATPSGRLRPSSVVSANPRTHPLKRNADLFVG